MEKNELAVIESLELVPFFTKGDKLDDTLKAIESEALAFVAGNLSVKKNRDAVKAMVTKVTKSKTYLESNGKDLAAEYKAIPKAIDENRKKTKDFLTELQAKVRQPLTDWEAEQERLEEIEAAKKAQEEINRDHEMAELMNNEFDRKRAEVIAEELLAAAEHKEKLEAEQAERDEQIRKEAEEKAKADAEKEKLNLIIDAAHSEALLINRNIDDEAAEIKRIADKIAAEKQRIADAKQAKINADNAAEAAKQAEIKRQQDEQDRLAAEQAKREADKKHIGAIRKAAKESLMALGIDEAKAKEVVMAIHGGQVANVSIGY